MENEDIIKKSLYRKLNGEIKKFQGVIEKNLLKKIKRFHSSFDLL